MSEEAALVDTLSAGCEFVLLLGWKGSSECILKTEVTALAVEKEGRWYISAVRLTALVPE